MPEIITTERGIQLREGSTAITLSAEEIYSVVFEGQASVRNICVNREHLLSTGLDFSSYAADPVLVLESSNIASVPSCVCRLVAKDGNMEIPVVSNGSDIPDYAVGSGKWLPLPPGTVDAVRSFLQDAGLAGLGPVSLFQYLKIIRVPNTSLVLDDRTAQSFSATRMAPMLKGDIPEGFVGSLYPYQMDGWRWLSFMYRNSLGAVIADEMGLGKTVQVACLLQEIKRQDHKPSLVVVPATLIENWRRELVKFTPQVRVLIHSGPRRTGYPDELLRYDVVVSSFETAVADISLFRNVEWELLIVDEAQGIKNPSAKRSIQLRTLQRRCAVAVTGTPVENRLADLWSIVDFVIPSLLGPLAEFERRHPDSVDGAVALEPIVSPLILRRKVSEVARDLPERIDIPQPIEMDPESAEIYDALRVTASTSGSASLAMLVTLRMFCTHPWLTNQFVNIPDATACSVKLNRLFEIFEEIAATNGKALVFTSYQDAVDLISQEISTRFGAYTDAIDGRVPVNDRQNKVDAFSSYDGPAALILNPKAAGTGLNITAANHVIHYNLEWNPATEDQASARAYRRGQNQVVTVHRLFYTNTVEEVIDNRMQRKRELAGAAIVGSDGKEMDVRDILSALRLSPVAGKGED